MIAYSVQTVRVAVDIGGTFTDFVVEGGSARTTLKLLTTPDAPERAVLDGVDALMRRLDLDASAIESVIHGTTLATNAVIERRGARVCVDLPGGGGYGPPGERTPERVERDLRQGYVTSRTRNPD